VKSTNKEFRAKLRDVDNILNLIYEYDQVAYATIVKSLHDKKFEWTSNITVKNIGYESSHDKSISHVDIPRRMSSMFRRLSTRSFHHEDITFRMSIMHLWIYTMIDITEELKNQKLLANIAHTQYDLICSIYPKHIIESLHQTNIINMIARTHDCVSIMFADVVGFTEMSNKITPNNSMKFLNKLFDEFDKLNDRYGIFKLETVGDCYVAVGGLFVEKDGHMVCAGSELRPHGATHCGRTQALSACRGSRPQLGHTGRLSSPSSQARGSVQGMREGASREC
jgi:hypothetical protein